MTDRNVVLILTDKMDSHADYMVQTLQSRHPSVEVVRFHTDLFPQQAELATTVANGEFLAELRVHNRTLDLRRVRSVWLRRPQKPVLDPAIAPEYQKWAQAEADHALKGTLHYLGAFMVNPYFADRAAAHKVRQLLVAREIGFQTPPTLVTNRPEAARTFVDSLGGRAVLKSLSSPVVVDSDADTQVLYTHIVTRDALEGEQGVRIRHVPVQLQGVVKKVCDLRVTVIGTQVFAVELLTESDEIDIRNYRKTNPKNHVFDLPVEVEHLCLALVRRLGLVYGAIDLLLTPEGDYVFLEINPGGQFAWLEEGTGLPLMAAMADLLVHGPERSDLYPCSPI